MEIAQLNVIKCYLKQMVPFISKFQTDFINPTNNVHSFLINSVKCQEDCRSRSRW